MIERGYGRIVNIASISGKRGAPISPPTRLEARAARLQLQPRHGIAAQGHHGQRDLPGYVDTPMTRSSAARIAKVTDRARRK